MSLNDGSPTYLSASYQTSSAIDIAVVPPCLATWFQFTVDDDPHFSDHFPIKLHLTFNQITLPPPSIPSWSLKHADWDKFREAVNENAENMTTPEITTLLNIISEAAERSIPISSPTHRKTSSPWWTQECAHAVANRKRALRNYQKFITAETRLEYLVTSRHCRAVLLRAKKAASWRSFISTFNRTTPLSHIWRIIKSFPRKRDPIRAFPHLSINVNPDVQIPMMSFESSPNILNVNLQEIIYPALKLTTFRNFFNRAQFR